MSEGVRSDRESGMSMGLLWFDDDPRVSLADKVENAARRYRERFGKLPNVCYVHPDTLARAEELPVRVKVLERASIQPNSFWIGFKSP
jgi:hypothetical protein